MALALQISALVVMAVAITRNTLNPLVNNDEQNVIIGSAFLLLATSFGAFLPDVHDWLTRGLLAGMLVSVGMGGAFMTAMSIDRRWPDITARIAGKINRILPKARKTGC